MAYVMLFRYQVQFYKVCERGPHHLEAEREHGVFTLFVTILDGMILNLVRMAEPTYGCTVVI